MRKKRPSISPWRRKVTSQERAETARMLSEWLRDKTHAPAEPAAREKVVRDLLDVVAHGLPVELSEHTLEQ